MHKRRASRERLLQALYQYHVSGEWPALSALAASFTGPASESPELESFADDSPFTAALHTLLQERVADIDEHIEAASERWRLARMAAVDLSLIRLGVSELLLGEVPPGVVIDEAVELAKRYGTDSSPAFVNGVLDGVRRNLGEVT